MVTKFFYIYPMLFKAIGSIPHRDMTSSSFIDLKHYLLYPGMLSVSEVPFVYLSINNAHYFLGYAPLFG